MATFYYNLDSKESINSQWVNYLQANSYIQDVNGVVRNNFKRLEKNQKTSIKQAEAINLVCGRLDDAFDEVNSHLNTISQGVSDIISELDDLASIMDWGLTQMIEEQRLTNKLLGQISELLKLPDSQKEKSHYIEEGLKYLKIAIKHGVNSSFYDDALTSFKKAEEFGKNDYITLNKIGYIHLYSKQHLNFTLSKMYYLKSARESYVELIAGKATSQLSNTTAESFLYASRAAYLEQNLTEAIEYAKAAVDLIPNFLQAKFELSKYLAANNQEDEAAKILKDVIYSDVLFSIKTLNDQDLSTKPAVLEMLKEIQTEILDIAKSKLNECKVLMQPGSKAENIIADIEDVIKQNTIISGNKAIRLLDKGYNFTYIRYYTSSNYSEVTSCLKILDYLKIENRSKTDAEAAAQMREKVAQILEEKDRKQRDKKMFEGARIVAGLGLFIGFFVGFFRSCTLDELSMDWGSWFAHMFIFALLGAIVGAVFTVR